MLLIVVVLYNKTLHNSDTLQGLLASTELLNVITAKLFLHDNSPDKLNESDFAILKNKFALFEYRHTPENIPLSRLYNDIIRDYKEQREYEYLVLLDDDSLINGVFFQSALNGINISRKTDLLLPVVMNNQQTKSPEKDYIIKPAEFRKISPGFISSKHIAAINSGMIISFDYLRNTSFTYDERFKNYGTDSYFMKVFRANRKEIYILDYVMEHSLSFYDTQDEDKRLSVFREAKRTRRLLYSSNILERGCTSLYNMASSIKNFLKHKKLGYLN